MPGRAVREVILLLEEAFAGAGIAESNESQALLTNVATVGEREWRALPPNAARSIESIALHVGACKVMYDDYAFGPGMGHMGGVGGAAVAGGRRAEGRGSALAP